MLRDHYLRALKYADAPTWKWFRRYRDKLVVGLDARDFTTDESVISTGFRRDARKSCS